MRGSVLWLAVFFLWFCAPSMQANIINVPADQRTIQAGIDVAVNGDTVLIADGLYTGDGNRDIDFLGKAIVVKSASGNPYDCIIDCEGDSLHPHRGFSFINEEGPGSVLEGVTITNGYVNPPEAGGGVSCQGSDPRIINCIFSGNTAYEGGGLNNTGSSNVTVVGCIFTGNIACGGGGMASSSGSFPAVSHCTFYRNMAYAWYGGGLSLVWSTGIVVNSTFCDNWAPEGSGIECGYGSSMGVQNCVVAFNRGSEGFGVGNFATPILRYCDIFGNTGGNWVGDISGQYGIYGNISEDPLFVLPEKRDYRLLWDSPCIDTGQPDSLDADGTPSDMGAYYFNQNDYLTLYVTPDMTEVTPGSTLGVTYTAINRWEQPEPFWVLSQVLLPGGSALNVKGPAQFTLPANYTAQLHITHPVPNVTPAGVYEYWSRIGVPPGTLYDEDRFKFKVID